MSVMTSASDPASAPSAAASTAPADGEAPPADVAVAPETAVDLGRAWMLNPQVALRPERFGALAYHFGTRRLSFLKSPQLLAVVEALADHPTARDACRAVGVADAQMATYEHALGTLARTDMIVPRSSR